MSLKYDGKLAIEALNGKVVVRIWPDDYKAKLVWGTSLVIPDKAKESQEGAIGTVVSVGPGTLLKDGVSRGPMLLKVGDCVIYPRFKGNYIGFQRGDYRPIDEADVSAKIVKDDGTPLRMEDVK